MKNVALLAIIALLQGCAAAVVGGVLTAGVVAHDRRSVGSFIDDQAVEMKAHGLVVQDKAIKDQARIDVTSLNGIVLLTGEAATPEVRDQILGQVRTIPSIRRINNEIRIAPPSAGTDRASDGWITTKVKTKLLSNRQISAGHVKVVTSNNVVYLMGLVTQTEGQAAAEEARTVTGVQRVVKLFEYLD